ncbi:hypothetical protein D9756_011026 [Leucocoprinus leucothites]|uniref:Major facilitator superfamily (MFS) profile domain-containing protein n=1 Tax=Leucocoprinus leucothites TaxID=201217 RepID=A0A8H5CS45_9AGAR|nr:hypothetical protein D9756_011026 [Leucoagaricus leucothites]
MVLLLIAGASVLVGIFTAIQNPAVATMEQDLPATSSQFSLSIALFIVVQGLVPVAWSAISEIKGRKLAYVLSMALATGSSIGIALSPSIGLVIGFRCIQGAGTSAFLAIGAATLADIYDPHERGTKMGIYYIAPLFGPSLGGVLGGGLTSWLGWRSIFWFCTIVSGLCLLAFLIFFRDTFRKERSLTYQNILKQRLKERARALEESQDKDSLPTTRTEIPGADIKITLRDVSPFRPIYLVLRRWNNVAMLLVNGIMFSWQMMITYTIARTLSTYYHYESWKIGLTSLAYGIGCILGSLVGGRLSDLMLRRMKKKTGGTSQPEIRLRSTTISIVLFPAFIIACGWVTQQRVHVAAVVVTLFGGGFFCVMMYSSILAYIVDANVGRSSSAVATNSVFRGLFAFMGTEVAVPLQDGLGDATIIAVPLQDAPPENPRSSSESVTPTVVDIEHTPVQDDPRHWSPFRKNFSLFLVSSASMISGLAGSIQNPAVEDMEIDLPATSQQFSLSIAIFILVQGIAPLLWTAISEVKGRRLVYLVSLAFFTVASIAVALSTNIGLVIAFRAIQAAGSSAIICIGAATLADIFEPAERGTKACMGIYYIAPLLGPALGPIVGGALTSGLGWRSTFWFLTIVSGSSWLAFLLFFRDTFRKERSLIYQNVLKQRMGSKTSTEQDTTVCPGETNPTSTTSLHHEDHEKANEYPAVPVAPVEVKLSLKDVNPFKPIGMVLRRINNLAILFASGFMFALTYMISYTGARTLSSAYHYDALMIGVILISYGMGGSSSFESAPVRSLIHVSISAGCVIGSLLGGVWSDYKLAQLKEANGGKSYPEMRLRAGILGIIFLPPSIVGFGWVCEHRVHIAALCVLLFISGFFTIWMYASTLAYIVDANNGRSATAVATNSTFRGLFAFVATEIAVPMQDNIGDGWLYTIWGLIMAISGALTLLVMWKGEAWRRRAEERESRAAVEGSSSRP